MGLAPVLLILCLLNWKFLGRPIFFCQNRAGKYGAIFLLYKFRSMSLSDSNNSLSAYGHFIRRFSLDELPSLFNIIKGDINFVGPRPLLPEYNTRYTLKQLVRLSVKPGLTGLAQIKGRNNMTWSSKFRFDQLYVKRKSLSLDLYIIFKTAYICTMKAYLRPNQVKIPKRFDSC